MGKTRKDALRFGNETKDRNHRQKSNKANKAFKRLMTKYEDEEFGEWYEQEMEMADWHDEQADES